MGRVKVIFKLPEVVHGSVTPRWPKTPLAYVEWYTTLQPRADPTHMMYSVSVPPPRADGSIAGEIVPLANIRQSCQLFPQFGKERVLQKDWESDTVLDSCSKFFVSNWSSMYTYQTVW